MTCTADGITLAQYEANRMAHAERVHKLVIPPPPIPGEVVARRLIGIVARYFHVPAESLIGPCRLGAVTEPRQLAMYLCRTEIRMSLSQVGKVFNGVDHTTVMYHAGRASRLIRLDSIRATQAAQIRRIFWRRGRFT